jgi:hypothetical protein
VRVEIKPEFPDLPKVNYAHPNGLILSLETGRSGLAGVSDDGKYSYVSLIVEGVNHGQIGLHDVREWIDFFKKREDRAA